MPFIEEDLVPFPPTLGTDPTTTHCRGILLTASFKAVAAHGHRDRYLSLLPPEYVTPITTAIASEWVPVDVLAAHYRTCGALDLPVEEILELGGAVVHNLQRTFIGGVLKRTAVEAGVSPVFGLEKFASVYYRTMKGGGARAVRMGPKDARLEFVGQPLSAIPYFRVAYRGFLQAGCGFFARRVVIAELASFQSPTRCAYRVAWV